ncbi:MAG: efflux RND transporter permease subunit [Armatimonadetes bacterium]|nr:efflux RND transporter permease subunit [Armatimonadota bacterium]
MGMVELAVRRPVLVLMVISALVVLGARAYQDLVLELYPRIDFPFVVVTTVYPGANPEEVETQVTKKIEDAVATISGVRHIQSQSQQNLSVVSIEFELEVDVDEAAADVRSRISAIRGQLPDGVEEPSVMKFDIGTLPVISLAMTGNRPMWQLRKLADDVIAPRLSRVPGVAQVTVTGGEEREIQVNVYKDRLAAYKLTLNDVVRALSMANISIPAGSIKQTDKEYLVRSVGEFTDLEQIRETIIRYGDRRMGWMTSPVRVRDVADVVDTVKEREQLTRLNGKDSVGIAVMRRSDANTVEVANGVKKALAELKRQLPPDINFAIAIDQSTFVLEALHDIQQALYLGVILGLIVVLIFLRNWRATIIIGTVVPVAFIATFLIVRFAGYTLNFMVMLGLALSVGPVIDLAIVALENIYRHMEQGEPPAKATVEGLRELGEAIIAVTGTNLVVFVPLIFLGAIVGRFFRPFAVTVVGATVFALFVVFFLLPMLTARTFKETEAAKIAEPPRWWRQVEAAYEMLLRWMLAHRAFVMVMGNFVLLNVVAFMAPPQVRYIVAALTVAVGLVGALIVRSQWKPFVATALFLALLTSIVQIQPRFGFMATADEGMVHLILELPSYYSLGQTDKVVKRIEKFIAKLPEVESYFTNVGTTGAGARQAGNFGPQFANIFIKLVDKSKRERSDKEFAEFLSFWVRKNIPEVVSVETLAQSGVVRMGSDVTIEVRGGTGTDRTVLVRVAERVAEKLSQMPELRDVKISWRPARPELRVIVDRDKAADLGFSIAEIGGIVRTALNGNDDLKYKENGEEYPIRIWLAKQDRQRPEDVASLFVGPGMRETPVTLGELAEVKLDQAPVTLQRKDRENLIEITANLAPWASLGNVQQKIMQEVLKEVDTEGTQVVFGGMFERMGENMAQLGGALRLSIVLLYMLMAALYNSLVLPFSIMFTVPQALVGSFLLLMLTGKEWNIVSVIGIIMVLGMVVNAAIILVDYTEILRERGMERMAAVVQAGKTRLRPVMMTVLVAILSSMPTALEWGRGAELRSPMAIAVIGGLAVSTILTLLVVPVAYTVIDDAIQIVRRWFGRTQTTAQVEA